MRMALEEDYDYVFLVNQDAWIEPNTVGTLVGWQKISRLRSAFAGILTEGGAPRRFVRQVWGDGGFIEKSDIVEAAFVNAAFWFIPVSALKKVGGFSPLFFHYGEDVDYIHRMRFYGYRVGYTPLTSGCHDRQNRPITRQTQMKLDRVYYLSVVSDLNSGMAKCLWGGGISSFETGRARFIAGKIQRILFLYRHKCPAFCVDTLLLQKSSDFANREDLCFWKMFIQIKPIWS